jgi:hypothetical protein
MEPRTHEEQVASTVAEQYVLAAKIGHPQLLGIILHTAESRRRAILRQMRLGSAPRSVRVKLLAYANANPQPSEWEINFLLWDPRYKDGVTVVSVRLDLTTSVLGMEVFRRGEPVPA